MSGRITLFVLFLIMLTAAPAGAVDADSVIGFWNTQDNDALFEIYACGSLYCGKISSLEEPNYPPTDKQMPGKPKVDSNNPDPALRNRPLVGLPLIFGFHYEGDNSWKGMIYNPEDGDDIQVQFLDGWGESAQGKGLYRDPPPGKNPGLDQGEIRGDGWKEH